MTAVDEGQTKLESRKVDFSKSIDRSVLGEQSIVVTGGANGIGKAFAVSLAQAGAYVTILDFDVKLGQALAAYLTNSGLHVQFVEADVSSWDDLVNGFEVAISNAPTQSIDIVITAAGLRSQYVPHWLRAQSLDGTKPTKPDMRCLDVNLSGTYMTAYLALHYFRRSVQDGLSNTLSKQIVFVGSLAGYGTSACYANYAASKYGVRGMWRALREECDILGYPGTKSTFRTSMLAPWYVETSMIKDMQAVIRQAGVPIATTEDCVDALMRIICDEGVHGRAVAVAPNGRSFDLCDDAEGLDAGRDYNESFKNGTYGADLATLMAMFVNLRMTEDHRAG